MATNRKMLIRNRFDMLLRWTWWSNTYYRPLGSKRNNIVNKPNNPP